MKILMKTVMVSRVLFVGLMLVMGLAACSSDYESTKAEPQKTTSQEVSATKLDVYKSPTCGCCKDWVDHIEGAGFATLVHHPSDLGGIKQQHGISPSHQSCHTAVSEQGYVFEGHVPAELMQRFLNNPPEGALGLAVPGMPFGSPGMEMGDRYDDYNVLLMYKDGRTEVFAEIKGESNRAGG